MSSVSSNWSSRTCNRLYTRPHHSNLTYRNFLFHTLAHCIPLICLKCHSHLMSTNKKSALEASEELSPTHQWGISDMVGVSRNTHITTNSVLTRKKVTALSTQMSVTDIWVCALPEARRQRWHTKRLIVKHLKWQQEKLGYNSCRTSCSRLRSLSITLIPGRS